MRARRRTLVFTVLALTLAAGRGAAQAPAGDRLALLVGVRQYTEEKALRDPAYAERDVTELARVLRDAGYPPQRVTLMTQAVGARRLRYLPTADRVRKELQGLLTGRKPGDAVLV